MNEDPVRDLVLLAIGAPPAPGEEMDAFLEKLRQAVLTTTDEMELWKRWANRPYFDEKKYYEEEET